MITIKTEEQIQRMYIANQIVKHTLEEIEKYIKPGISTKKLDEIAEDFIRKNNAIPNFKNYGGFPASICASVNDVVVHGIPSNNIILKEGDIISIDCGALKGGYHGDAARTFAVGKISKEKQRLIDITKECFFKGIENIKIGDRIGTIGAQIQEFAEKNGFSVVREMVGHGIGKNLHEDPEVPNYGIKNTGEIIKEGMTLAIEPMINMGRKEIYIDYDGWTCRTQDGKPSAHYENTVAFTSDGIKILSL
ncbi:MAG: type I methionyl aminopeptidase [Clostridiales bacterium]|nr:type I methionyl aminopeptidase [Clostridiales bacterium]